jgi:hypothetical protein
VRARVNFVCGENFVNDAHGWSSLTQPHRAHTRKSTISGDRGKLIQAP